MQIKLIQDAPVVASDQLDGAKHAALLALDLHELELVSVGLHSGEPHELLALLATHLANTVEGFENILGLLSRLLAHYFEEGSSKAGPEHRARKGSGVALEQELLQRLRQWLPENGTSHFYGQHDVHWVASDVPGRSAGTEPANTVN